MPSWLVKLLEEDGAVKTSNVLERDGKMRKVKICPNMTAGIVPVLEQLLNQDEQVDFAYFCDPAVKHVSKLRREGRHLKMLMKNENICINEPRWFLWIPQHPNVVFLHHRCRISGL